MNESPPRAMTQGHTVLRTGPADGFAQDLSALRPRGVRG